ncbi:MAG: hypothetical protein JWL90_477 [Chthoniobacteraceae bacterium]|nr:hypothetical protein [Chthoniobacteraceae bacterium]
MIRYLSILGLCLALAGCANTDKLTFFNYGINPNPGARAPEFPMIAPSVSDGLAINYANSMQIVMRSNATGSRIAREVSSTAQVALAAFGGVGAAFNYSSTTLAILGLGSAGVPELQRIFNAKARAEIYTQAAEMIQDSVFDYYSYNPRPSSTDFTPNGLTLVKNVSAALSLVENTLIGQLPSQRQMLRAVEEMSIEGTRRQNPRLAPVNSRAFRIKAPLPESSRPQVYNPADIAGNPDRVPVDVQEDQRRIARWISDKQAAKDFEALQLFVQRAVKETLTGSAAASRARRLVRDATTRRKIDLLLPLIQPVEKPPFPPVSQPEAANPGVPQDRIKPDFPGASQPGDPNAPVTGGQQKPVFPGASQPGGPNAPVTGGQQKPVFPGASQPGGPNAPVTGGQRKPVFPGASTPQ